MTEENIKQILPAAYIAFGSALNLAISLITSYLSKKSDKNKRSEERSIALEARRADFQRDNFISLQDSINSFVRIIVKCHFKDQEITSQKNHITDKYIPEELSEQESEERRNFNKLRSRVAGNIIRSKCDELLQLCTNAIYSKDSHAAKQSLLRATELASDLTEDIGKEIQKFDLEPSN